MSKKLIAVGALGILGVGSLGVTAYNDINEKYDTLNETV